VKIALKIGMLVLMAAAVSMTGCKKKPKAGGLDVGPLGPINDVTLDDQGLPIRPDVLNEVASQFGFVYFEFDSAQVGESERAKVEAVAEYLRGNGSVGVIVEGHCDERGSNDYNLALGERRALAVRAYLVNLGIDAGRIQTRSFGEERPAALGHDEASWSQNRRAEFKLFQ
jgi:peptidoglycan-associated lipoprotein